MKVIKPCEVTAEGRVQKTHPPPFCNFLKKENSVRKILKELKACALARELIK